VAASQVSAGPSTSARRAQHLRPSGCQAQGFRIVGTRERLGRHHSVWRAVLMVKRRNTLAGI
jgi:hypothetical protein